MAFVNLGTVMYPVGAVYQSFAATSPATFFGGTWTQITSRFLYNTTSSNTTGGSNTHTLTTNEMPSHDHSTSKWILYDNGSWVKGTSGRALPQHAVDGSTLSSTPYKLDGLATTSAGGGQAHNNMPAYITCYCWRRTA